MRRVAAVAANLFLTAGRLQLESMSMLTTFSARSSNTRICAAKASKRSPLIVLSSTIGGICRSSQASGVWTAAMATDGACAGLGLINEDEAFREIGPSHKEIVLVSYCRNRQLRIAQDFNNDRPRTMNHQNPFVDYYRVLGVKPDCSFRSLESAYHTLAKLHHPDHSEHADVGKLTEVINAYKALKDEASRTEYDRLYTRMTGYVFASERDLREELAAVSDAKAHARVLQLLYQKRRGNAQDAGVGHFTLQELLGCSDELFDFHVWYLREKGFILTTDQGTLAITIAGVDHVISMSRSVIKEKLLLGQSSPDIGA